MSGGWSIDRVAINCPELIEYVLKTNFENYQKGPPTQARLRDLLGVGIFNTDGAEWKIHRKTKSHLFSARMLRELMTPVFQKHIEILVHKLDDHDGEYFDIVSLP